LTRSTPPGKGDKGRRSRSDDKPGPVPIAHAVGGAASSDRSDANVSRGYGDRRRQTGAIGEAAAADLLRSKGYRIVARNWRCRSGELDIVAETDDILVFVEVRTRRPTGSFGTAKEAVDARKMRQVRDTAQFYLYATKSSPARTRFDVIAVELLSPSSNNGCATCTLEHIENAF
jgi:putative endonuclease